MMHRETGSVSVWEIDPGMEDPLLASGSTRRRREGFGGPERQESASVNVLGRRAGAITRGNKYEKAAAMVDQVQDFEAPK